MRTASCHRMRMEKCTRRSGPCSVEGLLTTGICPLAGAGLATILTIRFVGRTGSSATGVRDFAIIGIASMAAVSVTAAPAMGLLIVDSVTVPVDQRYSEGMLGAFSLDFTQNLEEATDAITLGCRHSWLESEGFSLSAANADVQEGYPVPLSCNLSRLRRLKCVKSSFPDRESVPDRGSVPCQGRRQNVPLGC